MHRIKWWDFSWYANNYPSIYGSRFNNKWVYIWIYSLRIINWRTTTTIIIYPGQSEHHCQCVGFIIIIIMVIQIKISCLCLPTHTMVYHTIQIYKLYHSCMPRSNIYPYMNQIMFEVGWWVEWVVWHTKYFIFWKYVRIFFVFILLCLGCWYLRAVPGKIYKVFAKAVKPISSKLLYWYSIVTSVVL